MRQSEAFLVVISGPSAAGKTTLVDELITRDDLLYRSVSATTRSPRKGEVEGVSYFFVDETKFDKLKQDKLIEWANVHGFQYGTPREFVEGRLAEGKDVVLNIDVQGGAQVKKAFPEAVGIFILPPSYEELEKRIRGRGTDYAREIERRMKNARGEIGHAADYDYVVTNDKLEECISTLEAIIRAERHRRCRANRVLERLEKQNPIEREDT